MWHDVTLERRQDVCDPGAETGCGMMSPWSGDRMWYDVTLERRQDVV